MLIPSSLTMRLTPTRLTILVALFIVAADNRLFFRHVLEIYPCNAVNAGFLFSLTLGLIAFTFLVLTVVSIGRFIRPVLAVLLLVAAVAAHFMDQYNVIIDHNMIQNLLQTDMREVGDLFNRALLLRVVVLGLVPAVLVALCPLEHQSWQRTLWTKTRDSLISLALILGLVLGFSRFYASFFREHKPLRYAANPTYMIYSLGKYLGKRFGAGQQPVKALGLDAHIPVTDQDRELIILVVGEAMRADHFGLNGYARDTTPLLRENGAISFAQMYSSGTSTAYSVPCMFSNFPRELFSESLGASNENLLDVLQHAGIHVLWRDNNSDSKGVALRVPYEDFKQPAMNPICDVECRDEGMLAGLQDYIDRQQQGDIVIVLHQMGNHGPAYYKRYPPSFERFTPTCRTNQLEQCSNEAIINTYDNVVLATDAFLDKVIGLLKHNDQRFETAMVYMSDHGESLGEYGVYLHSLPYAMAPESQKHIAAAMWFGQRYAIDRDKLRAKAGERYSHANFFHTVLGLVEMETSVYDKRLDILEDCRLPEGR